MHLQWHRRLSNALMWEFVSTLSRRRRLATVIAACIILLHRHIVLVVVVVITMRFSIIALATITDPTSPSIAIQILPRKTPMRRIHWWNLPHDPPNIRRILTLRGPRAVQTTQIRSRRRRHHRRGGIGAPGRKGSGAAPAIGRRGESVPRAGEGTIGVDLAVGAVGGGGGFGGEDGGDGGVGVFFGGFGASGFGCGGRGRFCGGEGRAVIGGGSSCHGRSRRGHRDWCRGSTMFRWIWGRQSGELAGGLSVLFHFLF
mmetsp:Transcript_670/g.1412  ORF Transcript_670/g.1412 Transcript_670/m.1412 type:complete len:257 (-) Transcript_670:579-1349(-)